MLELYDHLTINDQDYLVLHVYEDEDLPVYDLETVIDGQREVRKMVAITDQSLISYDTYLHLKAASDQADDLSNTIDATNMSKEEFLNSFLGNAS